MALKLHCGYKSFVSGRAEAAEATAPAVAKRLPTAPGVRQDSSLPAAYAGTCWRMLTAVDRASWTFEDHTKEFFICRELYAQSGPQTGMHVKSLEEQSSFHSNRGSGPRPWLRDSRLACKRLKQGF